jgi:hypothetical protein
MNLSDIKIPFQSERPQGGFGNVIPTISHIRPQVYRALQEYNPEVEEYLQRRAKPSPAALPDTTSTTHPRCG